MTAILQLPLREGKLEYTKARAIAKLKDSAQCQQLLNKAIVEDLSLTQIKEEVKPKLSSATEPLNFNRRISKIGQTIQRKGLLEDAQKRKEIDELLKDLERLIEE